MTFVEMKYSLSTPSSLKGNTLILGIYFKYTSEFDNNYLNFESLLQVYFQVRKQIYNSRKPAPSMVSNEKCINKISKSDVFAYKQLFHFCFTCIPEIGSNWTWSILHY